jgi:hypothetical protein
MIVRYFVQCNYYDTEDRARVNAAFFIDMPRDVQSNEDLYEMQGRLEHELIQGGTRNFSKIRITDFRVEGIRENEVIPSVAKRRKTAK